jgi:hypothetical protein
MDIVVYADNTLALHLKSFCQLLNSVCESIRFAPGKEKLRIEKGYISSPSTYDRLPEALLREADEFDFAIMSSNLPYDNNFFFDSPNKTVIVSFYGWNQLTDLPIENGLAYFIASMVAEDIELGKTHNKNTGCLNDFLWDKAGVDAGMRAAFVCQKCRRDFAGDPKIVKDIQRVLDVVSTASRTGESILDYSEEPLRNTVFDVFLCHNGKDKKEIRKINADMRLSGVVTWFDEEQIDPGQVWQDELAKQVEQVRKVCVFIGQNGRGPWQNAEIAAFLDVFADNGCTIIPVLLPNADDVADMPIFLRRFQAVDLREDYEKNLDRLLKVLRGR